jgi:hypothetical protein
MDNSRSLFFIQIALASLTLGLSPYQVLADTPTPIIGGVPVHCTDPSRAIVYTRFVSNLGDWARSLIDPMTGERLIEIDLSLATQQPPLLQLFVYAHECGHHISGDIIAGQMFHEIDLNREKIADQIGIRILRDQFHISQAKVDSLAAVFQNNPPIFPFYLPGPLRAQWIRDCYATNSGDCMSSGKQSDNNGVSPDPEASKCVDVDYTYDGDEVSWNRDPSDPTVHYRKRYENDCDKPVVCTITVVVGIERRPGGQHIDWQETQRRDRNVNFSANSTRIISGTLTWEVNRQPSMMPKIRYSKSRDDDYGMVCRFLHADR